MTDLTREDLAYIAGFLDGDGSILAQIVKGSAYKYKHRIRVSVVFYQKRRYHWFLIWLKNKLKMGNIRIKKDGMAEFVVLGNEPVRRFLMLLEPFLKIKRPLCKLVLNIIEDIQKIDSEASFIEVCKLVDKTAEYTYSKKRMITSLTVQESIKLPVETEEK
jgi:hypothetical protein